LIILRRKNLLIIFKLAGLSLIQIWCIYSWRITDILIFFSFLYFVLFTLLLILLLLLWKIIFLQLVWDKCWLVIDLIFYWVKFVIVNFISLIQFYLLLLFLFWYYIHLQILFVSCWLKTLFSVFINYRSQILVFYKCRFKFFLNHIFTI